MAGKNVCPPGMSKGFTLVELMISIVLALLLIVGINKVFQISSATVGAGQALSTISRDDRTAHTTMYADVKNAVTNTPKGIFPQSPLFFIACSNAYAFRNVTDQQSDTDGDPSTMNGIVGNVDATLINDRSHRTDVFGFLAAGDTYARQTAGNTANNNFYVSPTTSSEAFIWYGHLSIPNNAFLKSGPGNVNAQLFGPGVPDVTSPNPQKNDNNFFASDWILGRSAMLMTLSPPAGPPADVYITPGASGNPLGWDAMSTAGSWPINFSRYDIAKTSLSTFASLEASAAGGPAVFRDQVIWKNPPNPPGGLMDILRYVGNPFPPKPLASAAMAQATPIFIRSCAHFVVEYAGDFLTQYTDPTQLNYGQPVLDASNNIKGPDNVLDFAVDKSADPGGNTPSLWTSRTRWYGFPRDVNADGKIDISDVVPLRDVRGAVAAPAVSCERIVSFPQSANYAGQGNALAKQQYVCSWGNETTDPLPKMIRITIALDDPNGRLASTQFFEYVIDLTQ